MQPQTAPSRASGAGSFGAQLRALRESAGLTQEELAERAHLTTHAVSALERGVRTRPYPHTVRALATALRASDAARAALIAAVPSRRRADGEPAPRDTVQRRTLPAPTTPLVAREREIAEVGRLLQDPSRRLVTLTGPGGVGKTRLSLAVASTVDPSFSDGVSLVELAPLLDAQLVLAAVADGLGAAKPEGGDVTAAIAEVLDGRRVLLVLDNFEHLRGAAPDIAGLLAASAGLTILVSSRAALRIRGETEYVVQPMALPPADAEPSVVERSPAGALFLERARAVSPDLTLTSAGASAVAQICARVAGIPLALELAAARSRFLDPPTLLARLDDAVATDGARDLPARQRTMRAALDWSYGLLDDADRALLRLLSVFADGFTLDDAEAVADRSGVVRRSDVLRSLESLVEQSLVVSGADPGLPKRHHLLEPISQYAGSLLAEAGEAEAVGAAHTRHFLELAEQAAPHYQRAGQVEWLGRVDAEHANMLTAMERALAVGSADDAARLGWSLWLYWWLRGHLAHGRRMMETVLSHPLSVETRTRAEIAAATMAFAQDDVPASRGFWQSALERARGSGDVLAQANSLSGVGLTALASNDLTAAANLFRESLPLAEEAGEAGEWVGALTQIWLGTVTMLTGDTDRAVAHIDGGLASARRRGDRLSIYVALYNLSQVATARGELSEARRHLEDGLQLSVETGDIANLAYVLDALAVVEASSGNYDRVPVLIGAVQAIRESIGSQGYGYYRPDQAEMSRAAEAARTRLGVDAFDDAVDVGRSLEPNDAVAFGVAGGSSGRPAGPTSPQGQS